MERGFNAGQMSHCISNLSSTFLRYRLAIYRWRVTGFQQSSWVNERFFNHILLSPGYALGTIAVNVTRLERGFNAYKTPRCIYPSIFNCFWDSKLLVENCDIFIPHLCLAAQQGNFAKILMYTKLEWMGYRVVKKAWQYVQPLWYNTSVWQTDGQMDGRTDGRTDRRTSSL